MRRSSQKSRLAFWLLIGLIQLLTIPFQGYVGWWTCIPIGLVLGFVFRNKINRPFLAGFLALSLQWLAYALYRDIQNDSLLSERISMLFGLPANREYALMLTALLGGIFMGSLLQTGYFFGKLIAPKLEKGYY
jgi:hypothetical protein